MSEVAPSPRRPRADARRSAAAVLDAAVRVLGERPHASLDEVATAAGVSRQTVYAHYGSREVLLSAVVDRITADVLAAIDAGALDEGPATAALLRFLDTSWDVIDRYPLLLDGSLAASDQEERDRHVPITRRLERVIRRGQSAGEFDPDADPHWLVTAIIALGHAAGAEVGSGRMTADDAAAAARRAVLRVVGAADRR